MQRLRELPRLRELRERANLSQRELAKRAGLAARTIPPLEAKFPGRAQPATARKIARALGVRVAVLYQDSRPPGAEPFTAFYERGEQGHYLASCAEIPSVTVRARNREEASEMLKQATAFQVKSRRESKFRQIEGRRGASWEPFGVQNV